MPRAAVIGSPITHSLSPKIFSFISQALNQHDLNYSAIEVGPEKLSEFVQSLRALPPKALPKALATGLPTGLPSTPIDPWLGVNVTLPHKTAVLGELDWLSAEARIVGAANVIEFVSEPTRIRLRGHNTDVGGVLASLTDAGFAPKGACALLIGAGGAARAVAYALASRGARAVTLINPRSPTRAKSLALEYQAPFPSTQWNASLAQSFDLIVNCTPLGMSGIKTEPSFFREILAGLKLSENALAMDLIYNPEKTIFLEAARARGLRTTGGLGMLVSQAIASWEIWMGALPGEVKARLQAELLAHLRVHLRAHLRAHLHTDLGPHFRREAPIFLTGFMGAGKSTTARALAAKIGWKFIDTDSAIEAKANRSVAELFAERGEPHFRDLEAALILELLDEKKTVIALGGGSLTRKASLEKILAHGRLVFLDASLETIQARLAKNPGDERPLWRGSLSELFNERKANYSAAELILEVRDGMSVDEIVQKVIESLGIS